MSASFNLPTFHIEQSLINKGYKTIAGVDEAGRGALAGPLSLGLVIYDISFINFPHEDTTLHINDSKKLTPKKRDAAYNIVKEHAIEVATELVSHKTIDLLNVNGATEYALQKIIKKTKIKPDIILMDGNISCEIDIPLMPIKKGDSLSLTIASASIMAKVTRDKILVKMETIYPGYSLSQNKGYGTKKHIESIKHLGYSPIHRKTYEPVRSMISGITEL